MDYTGYIEVDSKDNFEVFNMRGEDKTLIDIDFLGELNEDEILSSKLVNEGNDGKIYKICLKDRDVCGKYYKRGIDKHHCDFIKSAHNYVNQSTDKDEILSTNWFNLIVPSKKWKNKGEVLLIYRWKDAEEHSKKDDIIPLIICLRFMHYLGFCHLDVSKRNMITNSGVRYLIDAALCCKIGEYTIKPYPIDVSSDNIKNRLRCTQWDDDKGLSMLVDDLDSRSLGLIYKNLVDGGNQWIGVEFEESVVKMSKMNLNAEVVNLINTQHNSLSMFQLNFELQFKTTGEIGGYCSICGASGRVITKRKSGFLSCLACEETLNVFQCVNKHEMIIDK